MTVSLQRLDNELEEQYLWRVGQMIDAGQFDNWASINSVVNMQLGYEEDKWRDESTFRKKYQTAKRFYNTIFCNYEGTDYSEEIESQKRELQKERIKLRDERNEYNRLIREEARKESYLDTVKDVLLKNISPEPFKAAPTTTFYGKNDLLIPLSDIHTGVVINNWKNCFDQAVLRSRLESYANKIVQIAQMHNSENAYIVIGEIVSGIIHENLRLQNNMDLLEQFQFISEQISAMLVFLSDYFNHIHIYVTMGNHSRISPKKESSLKGENMDLLLPFYLKAKLQNIKNISIHDNVKEKSIAMFYVRDNLVMSAHGDRDNPSSVVQNWTMMFGEQPDIVLLGHRHTNALSTVYDTKVIETGCVSGSDDFAVSIRKVNRPEQMVGIISANGLDCMYDVQLD